MRTNVLRIVERGLLVLGVCLLMYAGAMHAFRVAYQAYLTWTFVPDLPINSKPGMAIPQGDGMPIGKLEIPRLNLSVIVLEGVADSTLALGAGHVPSTALPGKGGNVGIAAHRDTFFRPLKDVRDGDLIRLTTADGSFDYAVEWTDVVKPTAVEVLHPTDQPSITLVTCYPFYFVGSAPQRFIVRARQLTAAPASAST